MSSYPLTNSYLSEELKPQTKYVYIYIYSINWNFRILKWRYVSTIFLVIFWRDIPSHRPDFFSWPYSSNLRSWNGQWNCDSSFINGDHKVVPPQWCERWFIIPWKLYRYIYQDSPSEIGAINQLNAIGRGHHLACFNMLHLFLFAMTLWENRIWFWPGPTALTGGRFFLPIQRRICAVNTSCMKSIPKVRKYYHTHTQMSSYVLHFLFKVLTVQVWPELPVMSGFKQHL